MAYDYESLQADIETWMENNSAELSASIPTIVQMAMQNLYTDTRVKALNVVDTSITFTNGTPDYDIPDLATMVGMRGFLFNVSGTKYLPLQSKLASFISEYWPDPAVVGEPKYYCVLSASQWRIAPTPNATAATRVLLRRQLSALSANSDTNWIITNHYDFALSACLLQASRFVIDDRAAGLINVNKAQYDLLLESVNAAEKRTERDEDRRPSIDAGNAPSAPPDSEAE